MTIPSERIRKVRKKNKLSQAEFADLVGVERTYVSKIETGKANPSIQLIKAICKEFGVREEWLLHGETRLDKSDGLTDQEIEDFELNAKDISRRGLLNTLNVWSEIILYMKETLFEFSFAYDIIGKPDKVLLEAKEELEDLADGLKDSLNSFYRRLSSQKPHKWKTHEEIMAELKEAERKYGKPNTDK